MRILSALPKAWSTGSVKGLRAPGGFTVGIDWNDGKVTSYNVPSPKPQGVKVPVAGELMSIPVKQD